jgi:chromosome segregation ATPase
MNVESILTIIVTAVGSLLGWEGVRWLLTRKSNARVAEAEADKAEVNAEADEFHHLREMVEWLQQRLYEKEERFAEQTKLVRDLQRELLESEKKVVMLETERSMKLCQVRGCAKREPQSGY